jgi:hypothetical protein
MIAKILLLTLILALPVTSVASNLDASLYSACLSLQNNTPLTEAEKKELARADLNSRLEKSLKEGTQTRDALCIIAETKRTELLKSVLSMKDSDLVPEVFTTVIRLKNSTNLKEIETKAIDWLKDPSDQSQILRVAGSLQVLSSIGANPSIQILEKHFESDIPENRVQSYTFFFNQYDHYSKKEREAVFRKAVTTDPLQVRAVAYRHYKELGADEKSDLRASVEKCSKDESPEVREECP